MSDVVSATGACLCGAVSVEATFERPHTVACHCTMCQRWGSGPYFALRGARAVTFRGDADLTVYDSSAWAERGFCRRCGTHLFYRPKGSDKAFLSSGLFAQTLPTKLSTQLFTDRKSSHYTLADESKMLTEAEVLARYTAAKPG